MQFEQLTNQRFYSIQSLSKQESWSTCQSMTVCQIDLVRFCLIFLQLQVFTYTFFLLLTQNPIVKKF